eukprot:8053092-Pyramimonas_sp.AAC.1
MGRTARGLLSLARPCGANREIGRGALPGRVRPPDRDGPRVGLRHGRLEERGSRHPRHVPRRGARFGYRRFGHVLEVRGRRSERACGAR